MIALDLDDATESEVWRYVAEAVSEEERLRAAAEDVGNAELAERAVHRGMDVDEAIVHALRRRFGDACCLEPADTAHACGCPLVPDDVELIA